jgi:nitrate reductase alpha subunit
MIGGGVLEWGSHCVDCYPSNCPYRVYVRDGVVVREEQAATFETVEEGVPDMNPAGCQKGASWSQLLYGQDRVLVFRDEDAALERVEMCNDAMDLEGVL